MALFKGTKLNPDKEIVKLVKEGLKLKGGYCPCELVRSEENKCPCLKYRMKGICRCGLFVKEEE